MLRVAGRHGLCRRIRRAVSQLEKHKNGLWRGGRWESGRHGGFDYLDDRGAADDAYLLRMLKPLHDARNWLPGEVAPSKTNVEFHRVLIATGNDGVGVDLQADLR